MKMPFQQYITEGSFRHKISPSSPYSFTLSFNCNCLNDSYLPALVAEVTESQCAPDPNGLPEEPGSIRGPAGRFRVRIPGAHALRLIIYRTGRRVRRKRDTTRRRINVTKGVSLIPNPKHNTYT